MPYAMERDSRRDRGQWRGCHNFANIICDGETVVDNSEARHGGLKMGQTYYYFYELDASVETHDPAMPSTSVCPYMPGQQVNTLWVPVKQSSRERSASVNSMRACDFQTMNPADKYTRPKPVPAAATTTTTTTNVASLPAAARPCLTARARAPTPTPAVAPTAAPREPEAAVPQPPPRSLSPLPTSRLLLRHQRSAQSLMSSTPWSSWSPRRLFTRRTASSRDLAARVDDDEQQQPHLHHQQFLSSVTAPHLSSTRASSMPQQTMPSRTSTPMPSQTMPSRTPTPMPSQTTPSRAPTPMPSQTTPSRAPTPMPSRTPTPTMASLYGKHRHAAPSLRSYSSSLSQGSRSRDISPESLRRFLVEDVVMGSTAGKDREQHPQEHQHRLASASSSCRGEVEATAAAQGPPTSLLATSFDASATNDYDDDDDEHNFATSATSESMPYTILSPPPAQRAATPQPVEASPDTLAEATKTSSSSKAAAPTTRSTRPTRAPPTPPAMATEVPCRRLRSRPEKLDLLGVPPLSPLSPLSPISPVSSASSSALSPPPSPSEAEYRRQLLLSPAEHSPPSTTPTPTSHHPTSSPSVYAHGPGARGMGKPMDDLAWMATAIEG